MKFTDFLYGARINESEVATGKFNVSSKVDKLQDFYESMLASIDKTFVDSLNKTLEEKLNREFIVDEFKIVKGSVSDISFSTSKYGYHIVVILNGGIDVIIQGNTSGYKLQFSVNGRFHRTQKASIKTLISAIKKEIKSL